MTTWGERMKPGEMYVPECIMGVDVGAAYATLCILRIDALLPPVWTQVETRRGGLERARQLHQQTRTFWHHFGSGIRCVWIEDPYGPHVRSVAALSRVVGAIAAAIPDTVPVDLIDAASARKQLGIRNRKDAAQAWAVDQLASDPKARMTVQASDHHADAYVIARALLDGSRKAAG